MATTYLTRTPSSGAATQKATFSFWVKKTNITGTPNLFRMYTNSTQYVRIRFESSNKISFIIINSDSYVVQLISTQVFRDTSAWYNIVCNMDTTQATASDRAKIYINGERITAYDTAVYPPTQDANIIVTPSGTANVIGTQIGDSASYFEGCMSHINFTDGYVYQASEFGETDSTTGEWKIKTSPSVTYGTNGFFILKDGNSVTDESGNSNNFAVTAGTLTNTEDCPSNNFATWNASIGNMDTLTNGNTTVARSAGSWRSAFSSLPLPSTGKFYCEFKISTGTNCRIGIADDSFDNCIDVQNRGLAGEMGSTANGIAYIDNGNYQQNPGTSGSYGASFTSSNVIGMAVDMTNMKLYFSKDGVYQNSGDPTSGSTGTGAFSITATTGKYFAGVSINASGCHVNFGNGTFGTTVVSSAGTAGSTPGVFEYDVPTGYEPLTTKGLNV